MKYIDLGHWEYDGSGLKAVPFGFVYRITNRLNGKFYFGRKQCRMRVRRKPLKGRKRVRIDTRDSDWRSYCGSCIRLLKDIEKYGKENFRFEILRLAEGKGSLAYLEAVFIIQYRALIREDCYNNELRVRIRSKDIKDMGKIPVPSPPPEARAPRGS